MSDSKSERELVEAAIPHRDPFLFVDRMIDRTEDSLSSSWTVPADAPWFRGHFPGDPILPGVIISEHVFQTAAMLISLSLGGPGSFEGVPVMTRIENARFRRIVRPGETLESTVRIEERVGPAYYMSGKVSCGGERVASLRYVLTTTGGMAKLKGGGA